MGMKPRTKTVLAWHFAPEDRELRYGDGRNVETDAVFEVPRGRALMCCDYGLHASISPLDALGYAPGPIVSRVRLHGPFSQQEDKLCAYKREHLWVADATSVLREFARSCALDVVHLWDAPPVVLKYLRTGDDSIRAATRDAARTVGKAWAGKVTVADIGMKGEIGINKLSEWCFYAVTFSLMIGFVGAGYGIRQRNLRRSKTEYLADRNAALEKRIDHGRTTSGLQPTGETREEDR